MLSNCGALKRRTGKRSNGPLPTTSAVKLHDKASSISQGVRANVETSKQPDRPSSSDQSIGSTPQAESKPTEKKPTSKPAAPKREQSDIFQSFSRPKAKLTKEDTGSSIGVSPAPASRQSVGNLFQNIKMLLAKGLNRIRTAYVQTVRAIALIRHSFANTDRTNGRCLGRGK